MKSRVSFISILTNILLTITKISVGFFSNSIAILASGVDSLADIISSTISHIGIKASQKPADKKHPYGHHKYEVLSGLIITLIIFVSGLGIIYKSVQNLLKPQQIDLSYLAFIVMAFSAIVNGIISKVKIYFGKKENSIALISDGFHSRIDFYASIIIFLGLFLTKYWLYADSFLSLLIAIYIIKESFSIGKQSIDSLLDVSAGNQVEEKIKSIANSQKVKISSLKTQKKGSVITANLEIELSNQLNVQEATSISNNFREKLMAEIENLSYVSIQIKSHELETNFYKPKFGIAFSWQRKFKFKDEIKESQGKGPNGYCICSKCGYKIEHQKGSPCAKIFCPNCQSKLERQ
jgi:cation diffusion facilitator family transporter